jgi:hypothetical protein
MTGGPWCQLSYWEERQRVGPPIPVTDEWIDVYGGEDEEPRGPGFSGVSLDAVARKNNASASDKVVKARQKIGSGE